MQRYRKIGSKDHIMTRDHRLGQQTALAHILSYLKDKYKMYRHGIHGAASDVWSGGGGSRQAFH